MSSVAGLLVPNEFNIFAESIETTTLQTDELLIGPLQGFKGSTLVSDGSSYVQLGVGLDDQILVADSAEPEGVRWANTTPGSGDVDGPVSSTDNALARFDGVTGKIIQNSIAILTDDGELTLGDGLDTQQVIIEAKSAGTNNFKIKKTNNAYGSPSFTAVDIELNDAGSVVNYLRALAPGKRVAMEIQTDDASLQPELLLSSNTLPDSAGGVYEVVSHLLTPNSSYDIQTYSSAGGSFSHNVLRADLNSNHEVLTLTLGEAASTVDIPGTVTSTGFGVNQIIGSNASSELVPLGSTTGFWQAGADLVDKVRIGNTSVAATSTQIALLGSSTGGASISAGTGSVSSNTNTTSIGQNSQATGVNSVALGPTARAQTDTAVAIGSVVTASGVTAVSIGGGSTSTAFRSVALGGIANATGGSSIAIGDTSISSASNAIAIGTNSNSLFAGAVSIGQASAANSNAIAIGSSATANTNATAVGVNSQASGTTSTAVGSTADASGASSVALGFSSTASATGAFAGGLISIASGANATAIARGAVSSGSGSTAIGYLANASNTGSLGLARESDASGLQSISIGYLSEASASSSLAIGVSSLANQANNVAIGVGSSATGTTALAIGSTALASGDFSTSIGLLSVASGDSSFALARQANASGATSVAIGYLSDASGNNSMALGESSDAAGLISMAIGYQAETVGTYDVAIGPSAVASGVNSLAIGRNATTSHNGSVALGFAAITTRTNQFVVMGSKRTINIIATATATPVATVLTTLPIRGESASGTVDVCISTDDGTRSWMWKFTNVGAYQTVTTTGPLRTSAGTKTLVLSGGVQGTINAAISFNATSIIITTTGLAGIACTAKVQSIL